MGCKLQRERCSLINWQADMPVCEWITMFETSALVLVWHLGVWKTVGFVEGGVWVLTCCLV